MNLTGKMSNFTYDQLQKKINNERKRTHSQYIFTYI